MSAECYFLPSVSAPGLTLAQLAARFQTIGLPATVQPDDETHAWIIIPPHRTQLYATVQQSLVAFVTLDASLHDPPSFLPSVERVLREAAFSTPAPA
ncbi:MAG: hypothetical protein JO295_07595 [Verrucomicrobia bacterium]|nr:hypothetical protein [Verrucomicrobiota bacterium]